MNFEQEFTDKLIQLAECRIDTAAWQNWWAQHSEEVKKRIGSGDYLFLDCVSSAYGLDTYMAKCQRGAERYLTKKAIPFQHATRYEEGAERERKLYAEKLEQQRKMEQEERQREYEQRKRRRSVLLEYQIPEANKLKSGLRTLPADADELELIKLLIEWTEYLAQEKYKEEFELFLLDENNELDWTPALLESAVYTYGCPGYTREEAEREFGSADYKVTSILDNPDKEEIIAGMDISSDYGWMGREDLAVIHYDHVPLNGKISDLTARFFVRRISDEELTLAFIDLHVM